MLDEDRLKSDESEHQYFGFSSTEIYVDVRTTFEQRLKCYFIEFSQALEAAGLEVPKEYIFEEFEKCIQSAEAPLKKFYEELQKVFKVPKHVLTEGTVSLNGYSQADIQVLEKECAELQQEYLRKKIWLAKLKQQKDLIEKVILPKRTELISLLDEIHSKKQLKVKKMIPTLEQSLEKLDIDFSHVRKSFY